MPWTPREEIEQRIRRLQAALADKGMDAALIVQRVDLFYFTGTGQDAHLFVPVEGEAILLVRKDLERAREDSPLDVIIPVRSLSDLRNEILAGRSHGLRALGMELDILPVNTWKVYCDLFAGTDITDVSPVVRDLRMIKSEYELGIQRRAAQLNKELFGHVTEVLRAGMTEVAFAGELESFYRKRGHQGLVRVRQFNQEVFYGHVMSGSNLAVPSCSVGPTGGPGLNPSFPHGPGRKVIGRHEPISIDYVGIVDGYMVDQARTFYLGEPPEKFRRAHATTLRIQEAIVNEAGPGASAENLYELAVTMASEAGYGDGFLGSPQPVSFVGHGVGLELDELPVVGRKSPHLLTKGMVIAIEPKIIMPGKGLAGIENSFVMTDTRLERLTIFDDEIQVID